MLTTRHKRAPRIAAGAWYAATFLMLSGCTLPHLRVPPNALNDIALRTELRSLHCRVEPKCGDFQLHVTRSQSPQAEMFPDGRLLLNIGLLLATHDEAEIAFILAHESAHRRLKHQFARTPERRAEQEIAADAAALEALRIAGFDAAAGLRLLERLLEQTRPDTARASHSVAGGGASPPPTDESVAQVEARIDALQHVSGSIVEPLTSRAKAADWRALLAPYRINAAQN